MGCGNSFSTITKDTTSNYCYTTEEIGEIESIINPKSKDAPEFKDEQVIFHKFLTEIKNLKKIIRKEYITIYTQKEKYPCIGSYKYTPPTLDCCYQLELIDVKINNKKTNDFKSLNINKIFPLDIPYALNKKDNPYITFEISYSYLYIYCNVYIKIPFLYNKENPFTFTIESNTYHFNQVFGKVNPKNNFQNLSNKIILTGKEKENYLTFLFIDNNGIILDNFPQCYDRAFYYMSIDEKRNIEKGINSCELSAHGTNVVAIRDEFIFDSNNKVNYKTYLTLINFQIFYEYSSSTYGFPFRFKDFPDFKILSFKIFNKEEECRIEGKGNRKEIDITFNFEKGDYFGTLEIEYSFSLKFSGKESICIPILSQLLLEGCYYQLYIKNLNKNRIFDFSRKDLKFKTDDPKYDYILRTFYKEYTDGYDFIDLFVTEC